MADIHSLFPGDDVELRAYADWLSKIGQSLQFLIKDLGNYCCAMEGDAKKWYERMAPQVRGRAVQTLDVFDCDVSTSCLSPDVRERIELPLEAVRGACQAIVESSSEDSLGKAIDQFGAVSPWYQRETKQLVKDIAIVISYRNPKKRKPSIRSGGRQVAPKSSTPKRRGRCGNAPSERYAIIERLHRHEKGTEKIATDDYKKKKKLARNWLRRDWNKEYSEGGGNWWSNLSEKLRIKLAKMRDYLLDKWDSG